MLQRAGGKDLTLFEVDEAASRIRDEADPDANIIVGATFDDSLEGIVRVSVVATGIDNGVAHQNRPGESSLTRLAGKLRNDVGGTVNRTELKTLAAATKDVSSPSMPTTPSLLGVAQVEPSLPAASIAPTPERMSRTPRMPRIDELPLPAQNEIRTAQRGEPDGSHPDKRHKTTLMQRLALVGLGRRAEEDGPVRTNAASRKFDPRTSSAYAREQPDSFPHNSIDGDVLDVPAFLRRRAN